MRLKETFRAWGHPNIKATHKTTLEITREAHLTPRGDCIIAIKSEKALSDLNQDLKAAIAQSGSRITLILKAPDVEDFVTGFGDERLPLTSPVSMVCRRSDYICPRTLMIRCDKSAIDIDRELVDYLRQGGPITIIIEVEL